jgi:hypothetical protein
MLHGRTGAMYRGDLQCSLLAAICCRTARTWPEHRRGRTLAVMLILLLNGFLDGMYRQIAAYLEHTPGSVIVAQEDITNLLYRAQMRCSSAT